MPIPANYYYLLGFKYFKADVKILIAGRLVTKNEKCHAKVRQLSGNLILAKMLGKYQEIWFQIVIFMAQTHNVMK